MRNLLLFTVTGAAVLWDVRTGKIPNFLILAGAGAACLFQLAESGAEGFRQFLGGSILPLFLLAVLYYFRMLGAGDIKLFCAIGGLMGGRSLILCMAVSFLLGALVSLVLLIRRRNLKKRLLYFIAYIGRFYQTRQWVPYRDKRDRSGEFCFTVPIFLSVLLYMGGVY